MRPAGALAAACAVALACGAAAQTDVAVEQLRAAPPDAAAPEQLSRPGDLGAGQQLTGERPRAAGAPQLTHEPPRAGGGPQLTAPQRSARPPAGISAPAQGRDLATPRLAGRDRCDPRAPEAGAEACRDRLEARAETFEPPAAPQLTAEERLLVEQARAVDPSSARSVARGLGQAEPDARALEPAADLGGFLPGRGETPAGADPADPGRYPDAAAIIVLSQPGAAGPAGVVPHGR